MRKVTINLKLVTTTGHFFHKIRVCKMMKRKKFRRAIKREVLKTGRGINIRGRPDIFIYNTMMKKEVS